MPSPNSTPPGTRPANFDEKYPGVNLDPGIAYAVDVLDACGVETYESCQGGEGHAYPQPTVAFHGTDADGFLAAWAAMTYGLPVREIRRFWRWDYGAPTGPRWQIVFAEQCPRP